jgi:hypothetical protein
MTKEQAAYASMLNWLGSGVLDPARDAELIETLGREHRVAEHSAGPCVDCPHCWFTVRYAGPADDEHFAGLAVHLTGRHGLDAWTADAEATDAWRHPVMVMAA